MFNIFLLHVKTMLFNTVVTSRVWLFKFKLMKIERNSKFSS